MAQFNAAKNPPWVRDAATGLAAPAVTMVGGIGQPGTLLSQPGVATPTVYSLATSQMATGQAQYTTQQLGVASLQAAVQMSQPGIAIPTTLATNHHSQIQTVSYPTPRAPPVQVQVQGAQQPVQQQPKQRVFTGTVTKLHDNFGFVDEDVFFQTNCVKGAIPKVGDRVLVEASYNANMPFKWNATRIQVLPSQKAAIPVPQNNTGFNTVKALPVITPSQISQAPPPLMSQNPQPPQSVRNQGPSSSGMGNRRLDNPNYERNRDRDRDRRSPMRRRSPIRKRSRSPRKHSRSPSRRSSPSRNRRQSRPIARYLVQVPKISLDMKEATVMTLKARYSNMYIPSDFFNSSFSWIEAFPLHRPFELGKQCSYHVMHKEVDPIVKHDVVFEPPDADHLFSAKVMLAASPTVEDLYKKCCPPADDSGDTRDLQHPTRLMSFLVGLKGKEPMAIGGPWSPSLDGANPTEDPRVLINTAIRTTRSLTGIDLAGVTQWYRFAEIRYHRPEEVHKGRVVPARVETVVLFLPDVWSCNPSRIEWDGLAQAYKKQLQEKCREENQDDTTQEDEGDEEGESSGEPKDPTHHSELDPKSMKVNDLRKELEARSLSSKGLKSQLIARLTKATKSEQETEDQEAQNKDDEEPEVVKKSTPPPEVDEKDEEKKKKEDEEKKRREERERAVRERRYTLPADPPAILVHPSTTAKSGKFDCTVMSLSVLLDYRPDDNKEHTFEVSLFAELFNEMIMRDFGFNLYKSLVHAPEKTKDEDKKDKKKDKDRKDKQSSKDKDSKEEKAEKDDKHEDKEEKDKKDKEEKEKKDKDKKDDKEEGEPPVKKRRDTAWDKKVDRKKDDEKTDGDKGETNDGEEEEDKKSTVSHKSDRESTKDKEKDKKKEKVKMYTANSSLLLSFCYFDLSHVGYIQDKDMEDIIHTIGLQLSRAQVKKLVAKVSSKDQLSYRKLTDKPVEKEENKKESMETEDTKVSPVKKEPTEETIEEAEALMEGVDELYDEVLATGNKPLLPQVKDSPSKRTRGKKDGETMVMHKGAMLDIPSMVQRLEKSEKLKRDTDTKLKDLQEEMDMLKDSCKSSEQTSQKVALELQELKKKLRDQRKATERSEVDAKKYYEVLSAAKTTLGSTLASIQDVTSSESSSSSSSSGSKFSAIQTKKEVNGD